VLGFSMSRHVMPVLIAGRDNANPSPDPGRFKEHLVASGMTSAP
jgi:hypothetical protein